MSRAKRYHTNAERLAILSRGDLIGDEAAASEAGVSRVSVTNWRGRLDRPSPRVISIGAKDGPTWTRVRSLVQVLHRKGYGAEDILRRLPRHQISLAMVTAWTVGIPQDPAGDAREDVPDTLIDEALTPPDLAPTPKRPGPGDQREDLLGEIQRLREIIVDQADRIERLQRALDRR